MTGFDILKESVDILTLSENGRYQPVGDQVQPLRECSAEQLGGNQQQVPGLERQGPPALLLLPAGHPQDHRDHSRPHRPHYGEGRCQGTDSSEETLSDISVSQGNKLNFGLTDADFIGVGASIFLTITLLMFTVSNLIGHLPPTLLESMTTFTGAILMITAGALSVSFYSPRYNRGYEYAEVSERVSWCGG